MDWHARLRVLIPLGVWSYTLTFDLSKLYAQR